MSRIQYLLRDEFKTDEAAPLVSPRSCEPGPGTLTISQNGRQFGISDGRLLTAGDSTGAWGRVFVVGDPISRRPGIALLWRQRVDFSGYRWVGWNDDTTPHAEGLGEHAVMIAPNPPRIFFRGFGGGGDNLETLSVGQDYNFCLILRLTGAILLIRGGIWPEWTVIGIAPSASTAILYPAISVSSGDVNLDFFRVADLAELDPRFATDYGLATSRLPGNVTVGQTFNHEADFVMEWTQTEQNTGGGMSFFVRMQDVNNYWRVNVASNGNLQLYEIVNGVSVANRANAAAGIKSGSRVVIIADGTTIRGYSDNILRFTYSNAVNFQTATVGRLDSLGVGGIASNLITYPRYIEMPYLDDKQSLFGSRLFGSKLFGGTL